MVSALVIACAAAAGCGKKGPPLAPIVHVPAAVDKLTATRIGNDVYLSVTIPTQNIDTTSPADVARIEIYGVAMLTTPPRARLVEVATKVASFDVAPASRPGQATPATPPATSPPLPAQGTTVVVRDVLTPAALEPKTLAPVATSGSRSPARGASATASTPASSAPSYPRRIYFAVAINDRNRPGPPGAPVELPLTPLPDPPAAIQVYTSAPETVTVSWEPSGGAVGFVLERQLPVEQPPSDESDADEKAAAARAVTTLPPGPTRYNVYREIVPAAATTPPPATAVSVPTPINPAPVADFTVTDSSGVSVGQQRCYTVRAVRGTPPAEVIGEPSARECTTVVDTFAPDPPTNLAASVDPDGGIDLVWEPNGEADLGGYLVLRGSPGDATLQPLTAMPLADTHYLDRDVMAGVRYVYAVLAVDTHDNHSGESNRVEETAR
ncbi:MAG TPA: fibronectin type III domain-containing protein [Vicinamibacterales bacterium]|nr:fibronectin type III domain-containing protein [Vicinamibacterales bacterium]